MTPNGIRFPCLLTLEARVPASTGTTRCIRFYPTSLPHELSASNRPNSLHSSSVSLCFPTPSYLRFLRTPQTLIRVAIPAPILALFLAPIPRFYDASCNAYRLVSKSRSWKRLASKRGVGMIQFHQTWLSIPVTCFNACGVLRRHSGLCELRPDSTTIAKVKVGSLWRTKHHEGRRSRS